MRPVPEIVRSGPVFCRSCIRRGLCDGSLVHSVDSVSIRVFVYLDITEVWCDFVWLVWFAVAIGRSHEAHLPHEKEHETVEQWMARPRGTKCSVVHLCEI